MENFKTDIATHGAYIERLTSGVELEAMDAEARWHFERRLGIGGSDVAAILGINKYKTPHQVWLEKTGRTDPEDLSDNDRVHFGNVLEDTVAQEYARRAGCKVQRRNRPFVHDQAPWLRANVDRIVVGQHRVLECKTADAFTVKGNWGPCGSDEVPESYLLQVTHYMNVLGWDVADLAVLIGGNDFRIYHFDLNHELNEYVAGKLRDFWFNCVIADVPPEPVTLEEINQFYKQDNGEAVSASSEVLEAWEERQRAAEIKKEADSIVKEQEARIKKFMGDNQILVGHDGKKLASWKCQTSNRFDTTGFKKVHPELAAQFIKQSESRVFRA